MVHVILRRAEVQRVTGLPTSTLYDMMANGRFPRPVRLTSNRVGWLESEIKDWQQARIDERDARAAARGRGAA
jgi:prophage regulatory protein